MMKEIVYAIALAAIPQVAGEPHPAVVVTEVPIAEMKDCDNFRIVGAAVRQEGENYKFAILLECQEDDRTAL